jgi:hypothetical protein
MIRDAFRRSTTVVLAAVTDIIISSLLFIMIQYTVQYAYSNYTGPRPTLNLKNFLSRIVVCSATPQLSLSHFHIGKCRSNAVFRCFQRLSSQMFEVVGPNHFKVLDDLILQTCVYDRLEDNHAGQKWPTCVQSVHKV